jgi:hypothetical protein
MDVVATEAIFLAHGFKSEMLAELISAIRPV